MTRAPGKNIVYLGCLLLVLGVFSMFYIRERRVWVWIKDPGHHADAAAPAASTEAAGSGSHVLMAMSTQRRTLDFEKEFVALRDDIGSAAGAEAGTPEQAQH
ncbi:hypothetical protein AWV80_03495 [Cupriavidus sp. UYMU48A]|nr:hypothetical protein AWV80_03495 [Cupriavidus sp. UYMU48A]